MTFRGDLQDLSPKTVIELFEWDATALGDPAGVIRWHPGTTVSDAPITWAGQVYSPMPIEGEGWEVTSSGKLPRPTLRIANIGGLIGAYLRDYRDGLGAKVTRRRTLKKYLDAVNFADGNPNADSMAEFPKDIYYAARKVSENPIFVEMELATKPDVERIMLPRRQVIAGTCQWIYRDPTTCTYSGPPVQDINGNATSSPALDQCRKTLDACKARFGATGNLMTSAFPASMLVGSA